MKPEDLLATLVSIPSVSGNERQVAGTLASLLEGSGIEVSREGDNLWFEVGSGRPRILLVSHLDTVPAGDGWSVDPHAARWDGDRLVGLGANDAKGCVAAMAGAAMLLRAAGLPLGTLVVAFTVEEEVGGAGIASVRASLEPLDAAVIGEPTGLEVCVAQRGMLLLRCLAKGRTAHSAHGELGINAVHAAARDILRLAALRFGDHPLLGETSAQVTRIEGGRARNQVPDACEFIVDLRTLPGTSVGSILATLRMEIGSEVSVHSARYVPCATDERHPVVQAALAAAGRENGTGSRTTSDWAFLSDLPAVKVGPGDTTRSHRPDEFLTRAELLGGVDFYRRFVPDCLARIHAAGGSAIGAEQVS